MTAAQTEKLAELEAQGASGGGVGDAEVAKMKEAMAKQQALLKKLHTGGHRSGLAEALYRESRANPGTATGERVAEGCRSCQLWGRCRQ